jgi:3-oxoacyl-[acyl-carrier protein] reductase
MTKESMMRTVMISGGSSGIGQATVARFARDGARVYNLDITPPAPPAQGGAGPAGPPTWYAVDTADWAAVERAVQRALADSGRLDVVIANAGVSVRHSVLNLEEKDARRVVDVNLLGTLALWQASARHMVALGGGVLLATSSVNGSRGFPRYSDYNATKAGIAALCRTFALELAPLIRVACVAPGAVLTPMQLAEYTPGMLAEVEARIPAGRHAAPEEVAEAFHYLASPQARFVTGQELVIDGGEIAGSTTTDFGSALAGRP